MNLHGRATGRALLSDADNITAAGSLLKSRLAHRTSREEIFTTIHVLRNQGFPAARSGGEQGSRVAASRNGCSSRHLRTAGGQL